MLRSYPKEATEACESLRGSLQAGVTWPFRPQLKHRCLGNGKSDRLRE